jgi:hypothetical protein
MIDLRLSSFRLRVRSSDVPSIGRSTHKIVTPGKLGWVVAAADGSASGPLRGARNRRTARSQCVPGPKEPCPKPVARKPHYTPKKYQQAGSGSLVSDTRCSPGIIEVTPFCLGSLDSAFQTLLEFGDAENFRDRFLRFAAELHRQVAIFN